MAGKAAHEAIRLENLTVSYSRHPAVHHLDGVFEGGTATAIVGPNGAGKSTLLMAVTGLIQPAEGRVRVAGRREAIAFLPQKSEIDYHFPISVLDVVMMGGWRISGAMGAMGGAPLDRALGALAMVGLKGFETRLVETLSLGHFQRVLFARLLLQDAAIILLDEPFSGMDARTTSQLLGILEGWKREGRTVLAVTHDMDQVRAHFGHTLLLARECVAWGPTPQVLTADNLQRAKAMSATWDENAAVCLRDMN